MTVLNATLLGMPLYCPVGNHPASVAERFRRDSHRLQAPSIDQVYDLTVGSNDFVLLAIFAALNQNRLCLCPDPLTADSGKL
jgi:hypothetical protein